MENSNPVGWFEIYVRDMERAKAFYEAVFELKLDKLPKSGDSLDNMWAFPMQRNGSGAAGALAKLEDVAVGPGGTIVYFVTKDCGEALKRAVKNGGSVVRDMISIGDYGKITLFKDLDGNVIGAHSNS